MSEPSPSSQVVSSILVLRLLQPELSGDLLAETVRDELITQLDASNVKNIVLDMSEVNYISSAGITPLLTLVKAVREKKGRLVLAGLTPTVEDVFQASRLITSGKAHAAPLEHQSDVAAAIQSLCR
ncbi:MAG: anti-sigma factor antagonist [Planctomycetia bacterium]|nr:anti-sigma factor antagonist [Planctomycetia bacterium]